jgi:tRNA-Thr(GGU) m(6)t(6)A37 methyltransferase TsaA
MFTPQAIGFVDSPYKDTAAIPKGLGAKHEAEGVLRILPEFELGLTDIEGFSHLVVIWAFDRSHGFDLLGRPPSDNRSHGVFATRSPRRPNPILNTHRVCRWQLGSGTVVLLNERRLASCSSPNTRARRAAQDLSCVYNPVRHFKKRRPCSPVPVILSKCHGNVFRKLPPTSSPYDSPHKEITLRVGRAELRGQAADEQANGTLCLPLRQGVPSASSVAPTT